MGEGTLPLCVHGNGESTMKGLIPLRVGVKAIAGVKDLPGISVVIIT